MTIFPFGPGVSQYQNVPILDFIRAKDDGGGGGDNCSYKTCKAPVKSLSPTNQQPAFYRPDALPVAQPTVSDFDLLNISVRTASFDRLPCVHSTLLLTCQC